MEGASQVSIERDYLPFERARILFARVLVQKRLLTVVTYRDSLIIGDDGRKIAIQMFVSPVCDEWPESLEGSITT